MKKKDESKEELNYVNDVFETSDDDEFSIGQCYEKEPASKIYCKKCLSDKFIVGLGSYYTAIKCPNCLWEKCIHDG